MLDTENTEVPVETEVVVETAEPIVEETVVEEVATEEVVEEVAVEATEEVAEEAPETVAEPILFDGTEDETTFAEKQEQVLTKYDLSEAPEIQALIENLQSRAKAVETPEIFTQIADYGDVETITAVLDEHNALYSKREDNGGYRPNTDKFVESLVAKDQETADYLYFDLASQPSTKYQGINKFEEGIAEALAVEGDTVSAVLHRYQTLMQQMKAGAQSVSTGIPEFIPSELYGAYNTLSKETREEMQFWDDEAYTTERANKLNELRNIQKGINADLAEQQRAVQAQQARQQTLANDAYTTESTFYSEMRKTMAEKLSTVQFSPDPKLNKLLSHQQVTTLTQAFADGDEGDFARQALAEAGINFDYAKAQTLLANVSKASQALTIAKHSVDPNGRPLNPVDLNKAQTAFKTITQEWLKFADDILKQEKEIATSGTAKAIETEVEKRKVLPKARPTAKSIGTAATKTDGPPSSVRYGSQEWDKWWAKQTMEQEAQKAQQYA